MRRRAAGLILALSLFTGALRAEGFESGLGAWSAAGLWQRVTSASCITPYAGSAAVYFGRLGQCDYDDHQLKDASLASGPVSLTDPARAFISFQLLYQVESFGPSCFDKLRLEYSHDGISWALLQGLSPSGDPAGASPSTGMASGSGLGGAPLWVHQRVDLSAFLGLTLYLRFRFVSSGQMAGDAACPSADSDLDNFLGFALDEINFAEWAEPVVLNKSVAPAFGPPGQALDYTLVVANRDSAARNLSVWDTLPAGAQFISATAPGVYSAGRVDWLLPAVPAGASVTLNLQVSPPAGSAGENWVNTAAAISDAPGPAVNSSQVPYKVRNAGLSFSKSVRPGLAVNGDDITYSLMVENYSGVTQTSLLVQELLPVGFLVRGSYPGLNASAQWPLTPLAPGDVRSFSIWGPGFANDGALLVNRAQLRQSGSLLAQAEASVTINRPLDPQVKIRALYPNPAPGNSAFGVGMRIYYETNESMPLTLDIFTVAGEKVRSLPVPGNRGAHEANWDLRNDWGHDVASGVYVLRLWSSAAVLPLPESFSYGAVLR
jgi:uncharacterized repeat protein (TIGR01451 family)